MGGCCFPWSPGLVSMVGLGFAVDRRFNRRNRCIGWTVPRSEAALIGCLLVIGFAIRVYGIDDYPIQLHNDEMNTGLSARKFLHNPMPQVFATGWWGQPGLGFYLTSLFMRMFGDSLFGLRMSSACYGMVFLLGLYIAARILFCARVAIIALILTTALPAHIHFSRAGFQQMQSLTFSLWALVLFLLALRNRRWLYFTLSGVLLGISFQTYTVAFLVPIVIGRFGNC